MSLAVYLKDVKKAVAVDDTTLKVYCSAPKANMLLTQVYIYILPEHIWGKLERRRDGQHLPQSGADRRLGAVPDGGVQEGRAT